MISLPIILASTFGALSGCLCLTLLSCIPLIRKGFRQYRMERQATIPSSISVYEENDDFRRFTVQEEDFAHSQKPELRLFDPSLYEEEVITV